MNGLTHLDEQGRARMVDIGDKAATARRAQARGQVQCSAPTLDLVRAGRAPKGSVISTAELNGTKNRISIAELYILAQRT